MRKYLYQISLVDYKYNIVVCHLNDIDNKGGLYRETR